MSATIMPIDKVATKTNHTANGVTSKVTVGSVPLDNKLINANRVEPEKKKSSERANGVTSKVTVGSVPLDNKLINANRVEPEKKKSSKRRNRNGAARLRNKKKKEMTNMLTEAIKLYQENPEKGMVEIYRTLELYDFLHDKAQDEQYDYRSYKAELVSNEQPPFKITTTLPLSPRGLRGWGAKELVDMYLQSTVLLNYNFPLLITDVTGKEEFSEITFVCPSDSITKFHTILKYYKKNKIPVLLRLKKRELKNSSAVIPTMFNTIALKILKQMYAKDIPKNALQTHGIPPVDRVVRIGDKVLNLTLDQIQAIKVALSTSTCSVVQSSFGTGKTIIGALIAAHVSRTTKKPVLLIAQTNSAVAQLARSIDSLFDYQHLNPVRIKAENMNTFSPILFDIYASTPIDIVSICHQASKLKLDPVQSRKVNQFISNHTELERIVKTAISTNSKTWNSELTPEALDKNVTNLTKLVQRYYNSRNSAYEIIFGLRKPQVLCITVDKLLKSFKFTEEYEVKYLRDPEMIIIDESSQLPEYNFIRLLGHFPQTRFCLIGDEKQLAPFSSAPSDSKITAIGRRSVLDILCKQASLNHVASSQLLTTFRCHPSITQLPNQLFYNNTLISGVSGESKKSVLEKLRFPNPKNPMAFIDVRSTHYKSENSLSSGNIKEREKCIELVKLLLEKKCVTAENISVVTLYNEQRIRLSEELKKIDMTKEVRVNTVDSIQGAEFEVVILLTTKTAFGKREVFFTNPHRINVAITRAKYALFIMGRELALRGVSHWKDIVTFCEKNAGIIKEGDIKKLF